MDYTDFAIQLTLDPMEGHVARIIDSPFGTNAVPWTIPFQPAEVEARLKALDAKIRSFKKKEEGSGAQLTEHQRTLGQELFEALFAGKVADLFGLSLAHVETLDCGLRVRLDFDADQPELVHLAALPWELLYKSDTRDFLGRFIRTSIVRYVESRRLKRPLKPNVEGPVRVLLVECTPDDLDPLEVATESRQIREALEEHPYTEVTWLDQPDINRLRRLLRDESFHVLHFMGHGRFDRETGEGGLAFVGSDSRFHDVTGEMFSENLKGISSLGLVVLSTCYGAALPRRLGQNLYSSVAPSVILSGVPAVIAMQFPISNSAATAFSRAFYTALAHGDPVDAAATEGRLAVSGLNSAAQEWATPALYMRVKDGQIFNRAAKAAVEIIRNSQESEPLRVGIRSFAKGWGEGMEKRVDKFLGLEGYFEERHIRDDVQWHQAVFPKLAEFLFKVAAARQPIHVNFAAHTSIAFASGYCLDSKSGLDVSIHQRHQDGSSEWSSQDGIAPEGLLWRYDDDIPIMEGAHDVALAISVTWPVLDDVKVFIGESGLEVGRIVPVSVLPETGPGAVTSGIHALRLAQQLSLRIRSRTVEERKGILHLFVSAPNTFLFFLGQLAKGFGRVALYEHDHESGEVGPYRPSMRFPPPEEA